MPTTPSKADYLNAINAAQQSFVGGEASYGIAPPGWSVVSRLQPDANGVIYAAYLNNTTNQIVVAFVGPLTPSTSLTGQANAGATAADASILAGLSPTDYNNGISDSFTKLLVSLQQQGLITDPSNIFLTGNSLGGYGASYLAQQSNGAYGGATFGSPAIPNYVTSTPAQNFTAYINYGDPVGNRGADTGIDWTGTDPNRLGDHYGVPEHQGDPSQQNKLQQAVDNESAAASTSPYDPDMALGNLIVAASQLAGLLSNHSTESYAENGGGSDGNQPILSTAVGYSADFMALIGSLTPSDYAVAYSYDQNGNPLVTLTGNNETDTIKSTADGDAAIIQQGIDNSPAQGGTTPGWKIDIDPSNIVLQRTPDSPEIVTTIVANNTSEGAFAAAQTLETDIQEASSPINFTPTTSPSEQNTEDANAQSPSNPTLATLENLSRYVMATTSDPNAETQRLQTMAETTIGLINSLGITQASIPDPNGSSPSTPSMTEYTSYADGMIATVNSWSNGDICYEFDELADISPQMPRYQFYINFQTGEVEQSYQSLTSYWYYDKVDGVTDLKYGTYAPNNYQYEEISSDGPYPYDHVNVINGSTYDGYSINPNNGYANAGYGGDPYSSNGRALYVPQADSETLDSIAASDLGASGLTYDGAALQRMNDALGITSVDGAITANHGLMSVPVAGQSIAGQTVSLSSAPASGFVDVIDPTAGMLFTISNDPNALHGPYQGDLLVETAGGPLNLGSTSSLMGASGQGLTIFDGDGAYDTYDAGSGNTVIIAGTAGGSFATGAGANVFIGNAGTITFTGGTGDDKIETGSGNGTYDLGSGITSLISGSGVATVNGGAGSGTLVGGSGDGSVFTAGSAGDSTLESGSGNITINGTTIGDDLIAKGWATVFLNAGQGAETLDASQSYGQVTMNGGTGTDTFIAAGGNTTMTGGSGANIFQIDEGLVAGHTTITNFNPATDTIRTFGYTDGDGSEITRMLSGLASDGSGGTLLSTGNGSAIDIRNIAPANFQQSYLT